MHPYLCASIPVLRVERNYMEYVGDPQECTWRIEILVLHVHSSPGIFKNLGVSYRQLVSRRGMLLDSVMEFLICKKLHNRRNRQFDR